MAESFSDPQWAEFEQINAKTLIRPRDDFVFRFGQDFEAGMRNKVGEIVCNPADGLVYRCIKETDSVAPDYTNATSNLYWLWIAGSISGYVSGRGWWTKFADGTLIQRGTKQSTSSASSTARTYNVLFPVDFVDTDYQPDFCQQDVVGGGAFVSYSSRGTPTVSSVVLSTIDWQDGARTGYGTIDWKCVGRWKA